MLGFEIRFCIYIYIYIYIYSRVGWGVNIYLAHTYAHIEISLKRATEVILKLRLFSSIKINILIDKNNLKFDIESDFYEDILYAALILILRKLLKRNIIFSSLNISGIFSF